MEQIDIKNSKGQSVGSYSLNELMRSIPVVPAVLHRTVIAEQANQRQGTQSTKTRSEVRGGGRKPYKQKKTGNARQGSIRSPHYRHGGVVFAPKPRDYSQKVNKREKRLAILGALSSKMESNNIILVDNINFEQVKTKNAVQFLNDLSLAGTKRVLIILPEYNEDIYKCFRNLPNVVVRTAPAIIDENAELTRTVTFSTRDVLVAHKIVVVQEAMKRIEEVWAS